MTIEGYIPAIGERDLNKINRSIRNIYENAPDTAYVDAALANAVRYDTAQSLTAGQQTQARSNIDAAPSISVLTNSLGADVLLNNISTYFTGPTISQGTTGTWFVSGTVTVTDTAGAAAVDCKLWDGTTIISSCVVRVEVAGGVETATLSGSISSPAGNIRISCKDVTSTAGKILFNGSGNSNDSTITALRIA